MSLTTLQIIDRLPYEIAALLVADDFFCDIPVIVAEEGNVKLTLERKQAVVTAKGGKRGVAVIVLQLMAEDDYPEMDFGPLKLKPCLQVVENVELNNDANGTKKSGRVVSRRIVQVLKPQMLVGLVTQFVADKPCIEPVAIADAPGCLGHHVNFVTYEQTDEVLSQVSRPLYAAYTANGRPQVQITCATAGAQIWFTTDDSPPTPGTKDPASTAVAYSDPIDIPAAGFILRARAFFPGMIGSQVSRETVTVG